MLFCSVDETYSNIRIPGLVITPSGVLLGVCECRKTMHDWAQIDILIRRSTDGGETWQDAHRIPGEGQTLNNPVLTVHGDRVWLHYCENYRRVFVSESTDDGVTFSTAREITDAVTDGGFFYNAVAVGPGHGIAYGDTVVLPVWVAQNETVPLAHRPSFITTLYTNDAGATWKLGEALDCSDLVNPSECALTIWQGNVISSIRNENDVHRRAFAMSSTGYSNWTKPEHKDNMPDPICQGSMISDGDELWHINCANSEGRTELTLKHSRDGFMTWEAQLIDPIGGYSDITVDAENIYILYEKDFGDKGLFFTRIKR